MQARGFLTYRWKYCWPQVIYCSLCVNQTNLNRTLRKKNWGGQAKIWGGPHRPPLRIATASVCTKLSNMAAHNLW